MTAFGGLGYYFHGLKERQEAFIQYKTESIQANRERMAGVLEERKAQNGGGH